MLFSLAADLVDAQAAPRLHHLLDEAAARFPDKAALRWNGREQSYAELSLRTAAIARGLLGFGVRPGDRVVVHLQNRPEVVEVAFACSRLGAVFVPANAMLKRRQVEYILRDSGARMLVAGASAVASAESLAEACPALQTLVLCDDVASGPVPAASSGTRWESYSQLVASSCERLDSCPDDSAPAALLYTSGSTGRAKGVIVTHRNLVCGARIVSGYLRNRSDDRILAALPLSFDYGFSQVTTAFAVGATVVLTSYSFPATTIQEVATERITGLAGVPTMWMHLAAADWPREAADSLRYITSSGGTFPPATIDALRRALPRTLIYCMYGLTEAFRSTYLEPGQLASRPGSIGKAIPTQEVLVLRPDGTECAPEEIGELVHAGSLVARGYWNDPERTRQRFRPLPHAVGARPAGEIAVWSGDLVRRDCEGYLYFVTRSDQMIKTSGHRVSPGEIEEVVSEVEGVIECVALGVPDAVLGQRIAVAVGTRVDDPGSLSERIRQHCRKQLPLYLAPAEIHAMRELPRNANGKHDRAAVARLFESAQAAAEGRSGS